MSWTDEEIDNLFKDGANAQSFKYDDAYFAEMEAASLPVNRGGKDFLWMGTALLFVAILTTGYFVNDSNGNQYGNTNDQLAKLELNTNNENTTNVESSNSDQQSTNSTSNTDQLTNESSEGDIASLKGGVDAKELNASSAKNKNSWYSPSQEKGWSKSMYNLTNEDINKLVATKSNNSSEDKNDGVSGEQDQDSNKEKLADQPANSKVNNENLFNLVSSPITAGLNVNSLNQLDQGIDQSLMPNALPILSELRPKAAFYVEFNGGMSQSLITPSEEISRSLGGGFGVETYLGDFNLTTGLNFKVSDHNDLVLSRTGKIYDFGSTSGTKTYDLQKVYSIELPISLGYNLGKHNFNIGVRPSFVVGGKMNIKTYSNGVLLRIERENGVVETSSEDVNTPSIPALKYFGIKPTLGYAYRMNKWTIGANIGVQLRESVNEDLMDGVNNHLPIDGQIYIRRTIRLRR